MAPATVVRHENVDVELGVVPSARPGSTAAATAPVGGFFSRLKQLLQRIIRATPQIICGGFGYFVLGRDNVQLARPAHDRIRRLLVNLSTFYVV